MSNLTGIILFSVLITSALILVSIANKVQTRNRVIRIKVKQLRSRIEELEDVCLSIMPLLETDSVPKLINEEIIDLIKSVIKLAPENASVLTLNLENAENLAKSFTMGIDSSPLNRIQTSDASIAKQQRYLNEAGLLIRRHRTLNRIEEAEMNAHIHELAWAHLMVGVTSHIAQGHRAIMADKRMVATGHYRNAQKYLKNSPIKDNNKHLLIKEVSEMLAGQRVALSERFMPETDYNPT